MENDLIYKSILMNMRLGFAYQKIICNDGGNPIDFEYLGANVIYKNIFCIKENEIAGKRASVVIPEFFNQKSALISELYNIALNGGSKDLTMFSEQNNRRFKINVFSTEKYYFATIFYLIDDKPPVSGRDIELEELLDIDKLQRIQDTFAEAVGVGSVVTRPDGSHITKVSNPTKLCNELIRSSEKGLKNCTNSDVILGMHNKDGPTINKCLSAGLWDAAVSISIGDRHVANWLIGQVKNDETDENKLFSYTDELGLDRCAVKKAYSEITYMPLKQFKKFADMIYLFANEISERAYQNVIQSQLIEKLELAEKRFYTENEKLRVTIMSIGEAVITTDNKGMIMLMNKASEQLTGYTYEEAQGSEISEVFDIIAYESDESRGNPVYLVLRQDNVGKAECNCTLLTKDGILREVAESVSPIMDKEGNVEGTVIVFRDITENKLKEKEFIYLSYHDMLTGLYNRRYFERMLDEFNNEKYLPLTIIMGDVNSLKLTNDIFGHLEGDKLLRSISLILKNSCGRNDVIARWGGDEFVILMPNCSESHAQEICKKIYKECYSCNSFKLKATISLGYASRKNMSEKLIDVLKHAELYMYYRKNEEHEQFDKKLISNIKNSMLLDSPITEEQVSRIKELATKTGACMQLPNSVIEKLGLLAEMHDIGNIAIKSETLLKSGELSEDERMDVKMHPEIGYRISHITNELSSISELILTHHEQWDGGGYPSGLSGNAMPLLSRILAVADSYVAMTSDRPHRKAMSKEKAIAEIKSLAGKKYDAKVVDIFINSVLTSETVN